MKARTVMNINIKDIALSLSTIGSDPVVVYVGVKESEKGPKPSKEIEVLGYAQFRKDKMVGIFEGRTALGLALLKNEPVTLKITVPIEKNKLITASIYEPAAKSSPSWQAASSLMTYTLTRNPRLLKAAITTILVK